jgi:hypothetical protein
MDPSVQGLSNSVPLYVADSRGSRSTSANSPLSSNTPIVQPRLASINEAYLLRHYQQYLAPWVSLFFLQTCSILFD